MDIKEGTERSVNERSELIKMNKQRTDHLEISQKLCGEKDDIISMLERQKKEQTAQFEQLRSTVFCS